MPPAIKIKKSQKFQKPTEEKLNQWDVELQQFNKDVSEKVNEVIYQCFNPKLPYYINDYLTEINGKYFETLDEFVSFIVKRMNQVAHRVTDRKFINFGKLSEDKPCEIVEIDKLGYYGGGKNGEYFVYKESENPEKEGKWIQQGPFALLNKITASRKAVNSPYHTDLGFRSDKFEFNTFSGFQANYDKDLTVEECEEICKPILSHIKTVWASNNDVYFAYIMEFIAYQIRELKRTNVMMVVKGEPGCGKGVVADFLQQFVFGRNTAKQIQGLNEITGQFNCLLRNCMLVVIDELSGQNFNKKGSNKSTFDALKRLITGDDFRLTDKGVNSVLLANLISYMLFTNHDDSIFLEEKDRRAFMILANSLRLGDFNYFDNLRSAIMNEEVGDAFYTLCRKHPKWVSLPTEESKGWNGDLRIIPVTELRTYTISSCKSKGGLFLEDLLINGTQEIQEIFLMLKHLATEDFEDDLPIEDKHFLRKKETEEGSQYVKTHVLISISMLYSMYLVWHRRTNNGELWSSNLLSRKIKEVSVLTLYGRNQKDGSRDTFYEILPRAYDNVYIKPTTVGEYDKTPVIKLNDWLSSKLYPEK